MSEATKPVAPRRLPALSNPESAPAQPSGRNAFRLRGWAIAIGAALSLWGLIASGVWLILEAVT